MIGYVPSQKYKHMHRRSFFVHQVIQHRPNPERARDFGSNKTINKFSGAWPFLKICCFQGMDGSTRNFAKEAAKRNKQRSVELLTFP